MDIIQLMKLAFDRQASDLHITVHSPPIVRIDGQLQAAGEGPLTPEQTLQMARILMDDGQFELFISKGDLDFAYGIPGAARYRINAYRQKNNVSLAIRLIPAAIPAIEALRLPSIAREFAAKPQGLLLVTGPTGSGKSTTLA